MFVRCHARAPEECAISIAAWKDFPSPLRRGRPLGVCATRGHEAWWLMEVADYAAALAPLPPYVEARTLAEAVREVPIP